VDLSSQTLNLSLGQSHPAIKEAVIRQAERAQFASSRFGTVPFVELSERLASLAPDNITTAILRLSNGSDAVETAVKLAALHTRRRQVGCLPGAWHGESNLTLGLASTHAGRLLANGDIGVFARDRSFESLAVLMRDHGDLAAAVVDPATVSTGLDDEDSRPALEDLRRACNETGTLLIFDEVQTFGGYLGASLFATEKFGVCPDIVCLGKALGAGYPLAAVLCTNELSAVLQYNDAEYTYGGHPVSCAAALAALDLLDALRPQLREREATFETTLRRLFPDYAYDVRRTGLMATMTTASRRLREAWVSHVIDDAFAAGIYVRPIDQGRRLLIKPPVVLPLEALESCLRSLANVCNDARHTLNRSEAASAPRVGGSLPAPLLSKPNVINANIDYCASLLRAFSPELSIVQRPPREQETLTGRLQEMGIPVVPVYADGDAVVCDYVHGESLADVLANPNTDSGLINGLALRHYELITVAHDSGQTLGDRWPGNAIVSGNASLRLIDFDLSYDGPEDEVYLFEESFCILQTLASIPPTWGGRADLQRRLLASLARRHDQMRAKSAWERLAGFYLARDRPMHSNSSPLSAYQSIFDESCHVAAWNPAQMTLP
jgi:4-aminobutyrate aminotransferase-like enzyme